MSQPPKSESQKEAELDQRIKELQQQLNAALQEKQKLEASEVQGHRENANETVTKNASSKKTSSKEKGNQSFKQQQQITPLFDKRTGTTDRGKDYEHLFIANIILLLLSDPSIENFYISSNNKNFGAFDDVVVEIKYHSSEQWETKAIQLKHKDNVSFIQAKDLKSAKDKNFGIKKYFDDFETSHSLNGNCNMILFTNCKTNIKAGNSIQFDFKNEEFSVDVVKIEQDKLVATSKGSSYKFTCKDDKYSSFFDKFLLYTEQSSVGALENNALESFKKMFSSTKPAFDEFVNFIYKWSIVEKKNKDKLHKHWMMEIITLRVLTPYIKPLSFSPNSSINEKTKTFREALSKFDVTVFDKKTWKEVRSLWNDATNEFKVSDINKMATKYGGEYFKNEQDFEKPNKETSKMLWLLGQCPLVVNKCPAFNTGRSFFLLSPSIFESFEDFFSQHLLSSDYKYGDRKCSFLQKLSDLEVHSSIYDKILTTFTYSLEGQQEKTLDVLIEQSEDISHIFTTDKLVQMVNGALEIGERKEILPEFYISRTLPKIIIDSKYLDQLSDDTLVVISCVAHTRMFQKGKENLKIITCSAKDESEQMNSSDVYISENEFTVDHFQEICGQNPQKSKYHLFRFLTDENLEWVSSKNGIGDLRRFQKEDRMDEEATEEEHFFNNCNTVNIICANPGMGKTTLMRNLKNSCLSSLWTIVIYARNHARYFRSKETDIDNVEKFFTYILGENCKMYQRFDRRLCEILMQKGHFQLIWDGLDEASDETFNSVLTISERISKKGVRQFITSRTSLKRKLEEKFNVFSKGLNQFNESQQKEYVRKRLELSFEELVDVFNKIRRNVEMFAYGDVLGIPLQIYMLTELLRSDKDKYLLELDKTFTIVDLYENFVEEKFNVYGRGKIQYDFNNEIQYENFLKEKIKRAKCYKQIAVKTYFANVVLQKIDPDFKDILQEIQNDRDHVGIITKIDPDSVAVFSHNSYGEYFAALYLSETYDDHIRGKHFLFDKKFNNIRFFLDLFMSKHSKGHVAILYKNCHLLEECTDADLECKDRAGRNIIEVACSRSKKYPTLETRKEDTDVTIEAPDKKNDDDYEDLQFEDLEGFLCDINSAATDFKKLMLLLPFSVFFYKKDVGGFEEQHIPTVLYFAIRNDFSTIIDCFKEIPFINLSSKDQTILNVAVESKSIHCLHKLIHHKKYLESLNSDYYLLLNICMKKLYSVFDYCHQNGLQMNSVDFHGKTLLHYACERGTLAAVDYLVDKGAEINVRDRYAKVPLHSISRNNETSGSQIGKFLINKGALLDAVDEFGETPVHSACENDKIAVVKLLIDNGAKFEVPSSMQRKPIHYACEEGNLEMVELLVNKGAKLDATDKGNRLPIHYACKKNVDVVDLLANKMEDLDVIDINGQTPLHVACDRGDIEIATCLLQKGASLNVADTKGRLPFHLACSQNPDLVKLLVANGANLTSPDSNGRTPLHYACMNWRDGVNTVELLIDNSVDINVADRDGRVPMHYACMNFLYGLNVLQFLVKVETKKKTHSGNIDTVELLIRKGANFDVADNKGRMPIHYACINKDLDMVELLVENKATLDGQDADGRKPVYYARNSKSIVELLGG